MNISNNISNLQNFNNKTTSKSKPSNDSIYVTKDAVRIMIDPRTLTSREYKEILKEKNRYPIINPDVLLYDDRLNLRRYSKL